MEKNKIESSEIIQFRIAEQNLYSNVEGFTWRNKREFIYHNTLYDVKKKISAGKFVILHCINDTAEEELIKEFHKGIKSLLGSTNSIIKTFLPKMLMQNMVDKYFSSILPGKNFEYILLPFKDSIWSIKDVPSPPPKYRFLF